MDDITVHITSDLTSSDRRVSPSQILSDFKQKMEFITGIPPADQKLWLYKTRDSKDKIEMKSQTNESITQLSHFPINSLSRIHIENTNPNSEIVDLQKDLLPKSTDDDDEDGLFKLDESEYDKMNNTVKKWKQEKKLGKYDPDYAKKLQEAIESNKSKASNFKLGDRCKISKSGELDKLGTIRYIGQIPQIGGGQGEEVWVGVELDEPLGKNDGSVKGHRYFECRFGYGSFVKPAVVEVGDFKEQEIDFDDSEDEL